MKKEESEPVKKRPRRQRAGRGGPRSLAQFHQNLRDMIERHRSDPDEKPNAANVRHLVETHQTWTNHAPWSMPPEDADDPQREALPMFCSEGVLSPDLCFFSPDDQLYLGVRIALRQADLVLRELGPAALHEEIEPPPALHPRNTHACRGDDLGGDFVGGGDTNGGDRRSSTQRDRPFR